MAGWRAAGKACILALALLSPEAGVAQEPEIRIRAGLEPDRISVGEVSTLEVLVETEGRETPAVELPAVPAGLRLAGESRSTGLDVRWPGGVSRVVRHVLRLEGLQPGQYRLSAPVVSIGGSTRRGDPLLLTVVDGGAAPAPPGIAADIAASGDEDVLLRAELSADTVYVGEPVTLSARAYMSADARRALRRTPQYIPPDPVGFYVQDVETVAGPRLETFGDRRYEVQLFRRLLVPIEPGEFTLPPARLEYELRRRFLDPLEPRAVESDSFRLVVLPLPDSGRPAGFGGAVGRFRLQVDPPPARVRAGDALTLTARVEGEGYIKPLPPPPLPALPGAEVFPPSERTMSGGGAVLEGRKEFSWVVVPREPGPLRVPPLRYPYFDPATGAYAEAVAPGFRVEVVRAASADAAAAGRLRENPGRARLAWADSRAFAVLQLIPLALLGTLALARRPARPGLASRREVRRRRRGLLRLLGEDGPLPPPEALRSGLRAWLAWRLAEPRLANASSEQAEAALLARGASREAAGRLGDVLRAVERSGYRPDGGTGDEGGETAGRARELVRELDRTLPRPPSASGGEGETDAEGRAARPLVAPRATALALAVVSVGLAAAVAADRRAAAPPEMAVTDAAEEAFREGVRHFHAGRAEAAAERFGAYVRDRPWDAAGWHNLGEALAAGGEEGSAVWAWIQGLSRAPRAGDTREALLESGAPLELVSGVGYRLPLDRREHAALAGLLWLAAAVALALGLLGRGPGWIAAGVSVLLVATVVLGDLAAGPRGRDLGVVLGRGTELRAAPHAHADTLGGVPGGTPVRVWQRRGEWVRGALRAAGAAGEGWLEVGAVGAVRPGARPAPAARAFSLPGPPPAG